MWGRYLPGSDQVVGGAGTEGSTGAVELDILPARRVHEGWVVPGLFSTVPSALHAAWHRVDVQ